MDAKTSRRLKKILIHMKERCYNPQDKRYKDWGARGITVCEEWLNDANAFVSWAITNGYKDGLSIDRIDNDGSYCPDNCRWVTLAENNQNRRSSRFYTINGETKNLTQWCEEYSVSWSMVYKRLQMGWDIESALTTPKRSRDRDSLIGQKFGRLTVTKFSHVSKNRQSYYECVCDCCKTCVVNANKLLSGHTRSCGCLQYEMRHNSDKTAHKKEFLNIKTAKIK